MKNNTSEKKTKNKAVIITVCICAVLVIALLAIFLFWNRIVGSVKMSNALDELDDCDRLVITDPLYDGGALPTEVEIVLEDDAAEEIAEALEYATEKRSFSGVRDGSSGFWDISVAFENDGKKYVIYLREDRIYVADGASYLFEIKDSRSQDYSALYDRINELLANEAQNKASN